MAWDLDQMNTVFPFYLYFVIPEDESLDWENTMLILWSSEEFMAFYGMVFYGIFPFLIFFTLKYRMVTNAIADAI